MQIVILAGGLATRLKHLSENTPKSMILIKGKPFIEYQIELLKKNGIKDIVLCVGHLSEQIKNHLGDGRKFGVNIKYSQENEPLGTGGAIKNAEKLLDKEFFVLYGDSYLPIDFQKIKNDFYKKGKKGLMTVFKNKNKFDKSNVLMENGMVIKYDKNDTKGMFYIDYGLSILKKETFKKMAGKFPLDEIFMMLIKEKELAAFEITTLFQEIGSFDGLKRFENFAEENQL